MKEQSIDIEDIFESLSEVAKAILRLISPTPPRMVNVSPFHGSWTVGELLSHLTK